MNQVLFGVKIFLTVICLILISGCNKNSQDQSKALNKENRSVSEANINKVKIISGADSTVVQLDGSVRDSGLSLIVDKAVMINGSSIPAKFARVENRTDRKCSLYFSDDLKRGLKLDMTIPKFEQAYNDFINADGDCDKVRDLKSKYEKLSLDDPDYKFFCVAVDELLKVKKYNVSEVIKEDSFELMPGNFSTHFMLDQKPDAQIKSIVVQLKGATGTGQMEFELNSLSQWKGNAVMVAVDGTKNTAPIDEDIVQFQTRSQEAAKVQEENIKNQQLQEAAKQEQAMQRINQIKIQAGVLLKGAVANWDGSGGSVNLDQAVATFNEILEVGDPSAVVLADLFSRFVPNKANNLAGNLSKFQSLDTSMTAILLKKIEENDPIALLAGGILASGSSKYSKDTDTNKSLHYLRLAKENGLPFAGYLSARIKYSNPAATDVDKRYAIDMFKESGNQGNVYALRFLGDLAESQKTDDTGAFGYFSQAAGRQDDYAIAKVGEYYLKGKGCSQNVNSGIDMLTRSVNINNPNAAYLLGDYYLTAGGSEKAEEGYRLLEKSAQLGVDRAYGILAKRWVDKRVVSKYPTALNYAKESEKVNDINGIYALGIIHLYSLGVPSNMPLGIEYMKKAAIAGSSDAMYCLYKCYSDSIGVERDRVVALEWLEKASVAGHVEAVEEAKKIGLKF